MASSRTLRNGLTWFALLCGGLAAGTGCQNKVHDENQRLWQQNRELQARNEEQKAMMEAMNRQPQPAVQQQPVAAAPTTRPAPMPEVSMTPTPPAPSAPAPQPPGNIGGFDTREDPGGRSITVTVPGDVLFDPGQATLKNDVKPSLNRVASTLKQKYAGRPIQVHGHTDSDPIRVSKWKSNQQLSEARADAVRTYLVSQGIDAGQITTVGHGDSQPKSQTTSANRRVEIRVLTSGTADASWTGEGIRSTGTTGGGSRTASASSGTRTSNGARSNGNSQPVLSK
jgi:flagellar motor protein MotB